MAVAIAVVFAVLGALIAATVLLGLPGTWLLLTLAVIVELADGYLLGGAPSTFGAYGWWIIGGGFGMAILGELLDLAAGALGAKKGGASRRGVVGAFVGGLGGALVGTFFLPIPLIGTLIGALLGTFAGALLGEMNDPENKKTADEAFKPAAAATLGRVLGTVGKAGIAGVVWLVLTAAAFLA